MRPQGVAHRVSDTAYRYDVLNTRRKHLNEALIKRSLRRKLTRLGKVLEVGDWVRVEQHTLSQTRAIGEIAARARRQKLSLFRFSPDVFKVTERREVATRVVFQQEAKGEEKK